MKIYNGVDGGYFHCGTDCGPWFCGCVGVVGDNYFSLKLVINGKLIVIDILKISLRNMN